MTEPRENGIGSFIGPMDAVSGDLIINLRHISNWLGFIPWKSWSIPSEVGRGSQCVNLQGPLCTLLPSSPKAIHFFPFRLVYGQSSFSRLTKGVLHMPTAASYKSSKRPRTWASWKSQQQVSVGCRQLRNDNHTRLSQTPCNCPKPHIPLQGNPHPPSWFPSTRGFGSPSMGASPQGNETAENNCYFSLFHVSKG